VIGLALGAVCLALAWAFTPLRSVIDPRGLLAGAEQLRASGWGIMLIPPAFVLLSLAMVPTSLLRWTTVLAFDPLFGVLCMTLGVVCATVLGHAIGQRVGAERLARIGGDRIERVRARIGRTGVLGIAALRQVPLGPFMIVNAVAGAARVRRNVFVAGTLIGMVPSVLVMVLAGSSLRAWVLG
jgi:uncharacterized membrane protein YdjX (TVP38/TMEM64 family)